MKLTDFIRGLGSSSFHSDVVLADIESTKHNLEIFIAPSLDKFSEIESSKEVKTRKGLRYSGIILKNLHKPKRTISATLQDKLPNITKNLEYLLKHYSKTFHKGTVDVQGISSKKAVFIANLSMYYTFIDYTIELMDVLTRVYSQSVANADKDIYDIEKYEDRKLDQGLLTYVSIINHLSQPTKDFAAYMESQLDLELTSENQDYAEASGNLKELPVRADFVGNLLYHAGKFVVEWQADNYKKYKAKKKSLELYVIDLENSKDGKNNAGVEQEIEYTRKRIHDLDVDIREYEEDA